MKIIKIGALWCPACLIVNNNLKRIKSNYSLLEIIEYDYDFNSDDILKYNVGNILPVLIFQDDSENELSRLIGEKTYDNIRIEVDRWYIL